MLSLLKQDISSSFSDLWYRVGATRPHISTHARVTMQAFGDGHVYIVEDPAGGNFYRLSASAYYFMGMLDGKRSADEAWQACNSQLGDEAPTQRECIDLLSKLQFYGLLSGELPLAADMIERRLKEAAKRKRTRRMGGGISFSIPLFNPDRLLTRLDYLLRAVFSKWGALAYCAVVLVALYEIATNWAALFSQLNGLLDPSNLFLLTILFIVLRAWHELGHAAACKAMGGRCSEMGLMLVALVLPFPYCDTSSAWRFPEVYKRVIVSAGGMLFETFIAAIATVIWAHTTDEAPLLRTMLFNTMVLSGITTVVFNANPLLRYDGYYILSDLTGSANLAQRAAELTRFLINRHIFKVATARAPAVRDTFEFWLLLSFNLLATPYRILITIGIVLFLWADERYLTLGAVVAVAAGIMWLVWPFLKAVGFLFTSPLLLGRRARALGITGALCLITLIVLGFIPFPNPMYTAGMLQPRSADPVRPREDGFVETLYATMGEPVKPGDPLLKLRNPQLDAELERASADVAKAQAISYIASTSSLADQSIAATRLSHAVMSLTRAQGKVDSLTISARTAGRLSPPEDTQLRWQDLPGRYITRGTLVALIATTDDLVVRSLVGDHDHAFIFGDQPHSDVRASFRVRGEAARVIQAAITRATPVASHEVTLKALTSLAGGNVLLDPRDSEHRTTLTPQFLVELTPNLTPTTSRTSDATWQPGLRARVRFETPAQPLAFQWWRRLQQYLSEKVRA